MSTYLSFMFGDSDWRRRQDIDALSNLSDTPASLMRSVWPTASTT